MTSLRAVQAKCAQADLEIKARQEEYGIDLYDLLENQERNGAFGRGIILPDTFTANIKEQWYQVNDDIAKYLKKQDKKKNRRKSKTGTGTGGYAAVSVAVDQWILQRKQKFGVDTFDMAFEVLGTSANNSKAVSTLSPQEKELHGLVHQ